MSPRVLLVGTWEGGAGRALRLVGEGLTGSRPDTGVDVLPFGAGPAFREALAGTDTGRLAPVVVGVEEETTHRAGHEVLAALDAGLTPVLEGGHNIDADAGLGLLEVLSGRELHRDAHLDAEAREALELARARVAGHDLIAAASTLRPLLGLNSVVATGVDLTPRPVQDRVLTAALARFYSSASPGRPTLPLAGGGAPQDPSRKPGSGSGGGAAALVEALGGRIVPTGTLLASATHLGERVAVADLVVVLEPLLHSPQLAEALLDTVTAAAAAQALPVVAVGRESTLSPHEAAEWGLHGVITVGAGEGEMRRAGSRIARTWLPAGG